MLKNELLCGDSAILLKSLEDKSIDFIITSPPYASQRKKNYFSIPENEYIQWFLPITKELFRVLKDDGSFVLNIKENVVDGERSLYVYELVMELKKQGWKWIEEYCWVKTTCFPGRWPTRFRDSFEHCYHFAKTTKNIKMNQDAVKVPIGDWSKVRLKNLSEKDKTRAVTGTGTNFTKDLRNWVDKELVLPTNVLTFPPECSNKGHPAVFPLSLPMWFIKLFSNEEDVVLDPFMGSGTTAKACILLNRFYIGIEKEQQYFELCLKNIYETHLNKGKNNEQNI